MAGSRLEYIGTIFSRTTGLLRTKAIKYEDRPLWYDIYRVFPPKLEPRADRLPELTEGMTQEVPNILYNEDVSRAALFKKFGKNPGGKTRNLLNVTGTIGEGDDSATRFIHKYNETKSAHSDWTSEQIVESISQEFVGKFGSGPADRGMRTRRSGRERSERSPEPDPESAAASSRRFVSSSTPLHEQEDFIGEELDDGEMMDSPKRKQRPIVTVDTLISMFKKAKEKDGGNKADNDTSSKN